MLIKDSLQRFTDIKIVHSEVSIVKLVDMNSGTHCDINPSSRMGVLNSRFIKFCADFDPRVRSLLIIVKLISKHHSLSGSGIGDHLSNYNIVLMVIFYLQTQGILHPLKALQDVPNLEPIFIEGYNFAFCSDLSILPILQPNECSIVDLLIGFFKYFSQFSFQNLVICPLAGASRLKVDMNPPRPKNFGKKIWTLKNMTNSQNPLVIQDPFELRRNTASNVKTKSLSRVVQTFGTAAELLRFLAESDMAEEEAIEMLLEPDFLTFKSKRIAIVNPTTQMEVPLDGTSSDKNVSSTFFPEVICMICS